MAQQASSVQADRSALAVTAAFLATGTACSLTLFIVLLLKDEFGPSVIAGWAVSAGVTALVAGLSTNPARYQARSSAILALCVALPTVLFAMGQVPLAISMGGAGLFSAMFAIPLVEWACGLGDAPEEKPKGSIFQLTSGREATNPIPSSLVLGMLIFAWPGDLWTAGIVAAPFFGFLLMLASLGGMFSKVRQTSSGLIAVHPRFLPQWFIACALATLLCAGAGVLAPVALGQLEGLAGRQLGGPVSGGPGANELAAAPQQVPRPRQDQQQVGNQGAPGQQGQQRPQGGTQAQPPSPPWQQPDFAEKIIKLLALLAAALILLWVARKQQARLAAFFRKLWAIVTAPFRALGRLVVGGLRRRRHEAAIRRLLAQLQDPYAEPPSSLKTEDLSALYEKLLADLALIGVSRRPSESVVAFVRRVGTVHALDRDALNYLAAVMTEGTFAPRAVEAGKLSEARERFVRLRKQIHASVPAEQMPQKQQAYRRAVAENELARTGA